MDIRRIKLGKKFTYVDGTKKKVQNKSLLKRITKMRIPPMYKKVKISRNPSNKVQAIGIDDAGRKQYIYSKKFVDEQQEIKFQDLIKFGRCIKRIKRDIKSNIESDLPIHDKKKVISMALYLIDYCCFRVGTEEYKKKYKTYGATTLNKNHIVFRDEEVDIEFVGKKSVINKKTIKNENVINLLQKLCKYNSNREYLFYYKDDNQELHSINANMINNYLKKYNKTLIAKMFRTWNGNKVLLKELMHMDKPNNEKEIKKNLLKAIKKVAEELHNTVAVSRKSYLNSEIYTTYLNDNDKFYEFLEENKRKNGDNKSFDRILSLFLIKFYKKE